MAARSRQTRVFFLEERVRTASKTMVVNTKNEKALISQKWRKCRIQVQSIFCMELLRRSKLGLLSFWIILLQTLESDLFTTRRHACSLMSWGVLLLQIFLACIYLRHFQETVSLPWNGDYLIKWCNDDVIMKSAKYFDAFSLVVTHSHLWSLLITRGRLVDTRGHSWSLLVTRVYF